MKPAGYRIAVVLPAHLSELTGGAETQAHMIAQALVARGNEVHYLARRILHGSQGTSYTTHKVGTLNRITKHNLFFDTPGLTRKLAELSPDLVYQRVAGPYSAIAARYCAVSQTPVVWHIALDSDVSKTQWKRLWWRPWKAVDRLALAWARPRMTHIVAQTSWQAQQFDPSSSGRQIVVIPNFRPDSVGELPDFEHRDTVLWLANLKPAKRPELFVELARHLARLDRIKFVIGGRLQGSPYWNSRMESLFAKQPNIQYLGLVSADGVGELLDRSIALVNTSAVEGFPNTFLEAWERSVPVVSLDVDPDDIITRHGLGRRAGSVDSLGQAILHLVDHPEEAARAGQRARAYFLKNHSLRNVDRLCEHLESWASVGRNHTRCG